MPACRYRKVAILTGLSACHRHDDLWRTDAPPTSLSATNGSVEWRPFALPVQVWISTVIILLEQRYVYHRGKVALIRFDQASGEEMAYRDDCSGSGIHFVAITCLA